MLIQHFINSNSILLIASIEFINHKPIVYFYNQMSIQHSIDSRSIFLITSIEFINHKPVVYF